MIKRHIAMLILFLLTGKMLQAQSNQAFIDSAMTLIAQKKFSAASRMISRSKGKKEKENAPSYAAKAWLINEGRRYNWFESMYDNFSASYYPFNEKLAKADDPKAIAGQQEWPPKMLENADLALKYDSRNILAHLMRGVYFSYKKDEATATAEFDLVEQLDPSNCYLHFNRANLVADKDRERAIAAYKKTIACAPKYTLALLHLGLNYLELKRFDEALTTIKDYAALENTETAHALVGEFYKVTLASSPANIKYLPEVSEFLRSQSKLTVDRKEYFNSYTNVIRALSVHQTQATKDLISACVQGNVAGALAAIQAGADVNAPFSAAYRTIDYPLLFAARSRSLPLMDALIAKKADVNVQNDLGYSALHWLGSSNQEAGDKDVLPMAQVLFNQKADLNIRDMNGETPLLHAMTYMNESYIDFLIGAGADVNLASDAGITPLNAYSGTDDSAVLVKLLLDAGADPDVTAKTGRNIYKEATYMFPSSMAVIYLLEKARPGSKALPADHKNINFIRKYVVGKPVAALMDAIIAGDLKAFKAALPNVKDSLARNYVSIATMNFTYGKIFYDEFLKAGVKPGQGMYSEKYNKVIGPKLAFYKTVTAGQYADLDLYYYWDFVEVKQLLADNKRYQQLMTATSFLHVNQRCGYIQEVARVNRQMIQIYAKILANHNNGTTQLSAASLAFIKKSHDDLLESVRNFEAAAMKYGCR